MGRQGPYRVRQDAPFLLMSKHAVSLAVPGVDVKDQVKSFPHHS